VPALALRGFVIRVGWYDDPGPDGQRDALRWTRARKRALETVRQHPSRARQSNRTNPRTGDVHWLAAEWLVGAGLVIEKENGTLCPTELGLKVRP
jgi:hypothetical protein